MVFIGKKIFLFFFNSFEKKKMRDLVIFSSKQQKIIININEINYQYLQIREIKITVIKYYLDKININKSFKDHLFNYLYKNEPNIHKKSCIIKYLLEKRFKIDEISASFLKKSDVALFSIFNLKIKKIKPIKINILISMISLLLYRISKQRQINKTSFGKKSKFNPKIKYYKMLRSKDKNQQFEDIYINRLGKSLENTIICISPYQKRVYPPRGSKNPEQLTSNKNNIFYYNPKINFYLALKKAIKIYFNPFLKGFKKPLIEIVIQRMGIDLFIRYIKKYFPSIREFYTGTEFYNGLVYLTEKLKESNIRVIFFIIGVGGPSRSPIANYDELYLFSKLQKNSYLGNSKIKFFRLNLSLESTKDYSEKKFALLFICTVFLKTKLIHYNSIYMETINYIERIAREFKFPVYAKYHPLSTEADKILSKNINIIERIEDLPQDYFYLSTTMMSTYVLELLNLMPFLIINPQNRNNMKYYLPNDAFIYAKTYKEFKEKINNFLTNPYFYIEYWEALISLLKEYYFFLE